MTNIAIFASGSGTNAENIVNYFKNHSRICVKLIASNNAHAFVMERAKKLGVESLVFTKTELENGTLLRLLNEKKIDVIVLAGFLLKMPKEFISAFPNKIVNIHPSLLPKFGGKGMYGNRVHEAVIAAGEKESGITIHYVNEEYDKGDIIFQATCPVLDNDTPDSLAKKVHELEYLYFPNIIEKYLD